MDGRCGTDDLSLLNDVLLSAVICLRQRLEHACFSVSVTQQDCQWRIKTTMILAVLPLTWTDVENNGLMHVSA